MVLGEGEMRQLARGETIFLTYDDIAHLPAFHFLFFPTLVVMNSFTRTKLEGAMLYKLLSLARLQYAVNYA